MTTNFTNLSDIIDLNEPGNDNESYKLKNKVDNKLPGFINKKSLKKSNEDSFEEQYDNQSSNNLQDSINKIINSPPKISPPVRYSMGQNMPPLRDNTPPLRDNTPPLRDNMPPMRENMPSMRENMAPMRENMPSMRENMAPMRENMASRNNSRRNFMGQRFRNNKDRYTNRMPVRETENYDNYIVNQLHDNQESIHSNLLSHSKIDDMIHKYDNLCEICNKINQNNDQMHQTYNMIIAFMFVIILMLIKKKM